MKKMTPLLDSTAVLATVVFLGYGGYSVAPAALGGEPGRGHRTIGRAPTTTERLAANTGRPGMSTRSSPEHAANSSGTCVESQDHAEHPDHMAPAGASATAFIRALGATP